MCEEIDEYGNRVVVSSNDGSLMDSERSLEVVIEANMTAENPSKDIHTSPLKPLVQDASTDLPELDPTPEELASKQEQQEMHMVN